jgi:hypothetical protein
MFCTAANAMQVSQWDSLSDIQKKDFLIVLIGGTIDNLKTNGHADQVPVLMDLFFNKDPAIATGTQEFLNNIGFIRQKNTTLSGNKLEIEDAFYFALNYHKIDVPLQDILTIGKTFKVPSPTH